MRTSPAVDAGPQELFDSLRTPIRAFLGRVLRHDEWVEEAAAETWLALLERHRRRFRPRDWSAYALRVAWSQALRVQRRHRAAASTERDPTLAVDTAPDPRRLVELRELLERSFGMLDPVDRALLHLRFERDAGHAEIARIMGWPKGTVKRRIHEARHRLLAVFERLGVERANLALCALWPLAIDDGPGAGGLAPAVRRFLAGGALVAGLAFTIPVRAPTGERGTPVLVRSASALAAAPAPSPGDVADVRIREVEVPAGLPAEVATPTEAARPAWIEGRVLDLCERPVTGATVRLAAFDGGERVERTTVTDGEGRYALPDVRPSGDGRPDGAVLEVRAAGFAASWRRLATVPPAGRSASREVDVFVGRPGVLTGRVYDAETGEPIAGARVVLWSNLSLGAAKPGLLFAPRDPLGPEVLAEAVTGPDGAYALAALPTRAAGVPPRPPSVADGAAPLDPFHGGVTVHAVGYAPLPSMVRLPAGEGEESTHDAELYRSGSVVGRVLDAAGRPCAGATVEAGVEGRTTSHYRAFAAESPEGTPWRATTDDAGRYRIDGLPCRRDGRTPVRVSVAGGDARFAEARADATVRVADLLVRDGSRGAAVEPAAPPGVAGCLTGRILRADLSAPAGVLVVATPVGFERDAWESAPAGAAEEWLRTSRTDAAGRFRIDGLPPGELDLHVVATRRGGPPPSFADLRPVGRARVGGAFEARIPPDVHPATGSVEIAVRGEAASPAPRKGLRAWLDDGSGPRDEALVVGPGRLVFAEVPAGAFRLVVEAEGFRRGEAALFVPANARTSVTMTLEPGFTVHGRVTLPSDLPSGATVGVIAERGAPPETIVGDVGADGAFRVDGLPDGEWRLTVYARDRLAGRSWSSVPLSVVLEGAPLEGVLEATLVPLETLCVRLEGIAAPAATAPDDAFLRVSYVLCREFRLVVLDARGRVWFDRPPYAFGGEQDGSDWHAPVPLPPGSYRVRLVREDGEVREHPAVVPGDLRIDLRSFPPFEGPGSPR